ncbi:MAG TPA: GNAT family N-acetyltransferase [Xanthobacteraceae bacterium]|nr:GNAT family N-acetyltransferase [Xanthobacteraceae bacterium]
MSAQSDLTGTVLTSKRVLLRAFVFADAPDVFADASLTISRFMTWEPPPSLEAFAEIWPEWLRQMAAGSDLHLVIREASTSEFMGIAGLHGIGISEPTVGIWIKEAAHRLGYGRESIASILEWACAHVGAEALLYPVVEQNHPSRRLAESLKGVVVGTRELRKPGGVLFNQVVYRIPAPEEHRLKAVTNG